MQKPVQIVYSHVAEKELGKFPKQIASRILSKVFDNASQQDVLARAKALTGRFAGAYRYRVGDYRVVFVLDDEGNILVLIVLTIKHRKDIYK
jgi:mRNA interferase RelE/StbE